MMTYLFKMTCKPFDVNLREDYYLCDVVILSSYRFQTELGYDFLEIHDGPNLLSPLIGSFNGTQVPQFLFSSSNFLYLLFTTDNSRSNAGFKILYESEFETKTVCLYTYIHLLTTIHRYKADFRILCSMLCCLQIKAESRTASIGT